MMNPAVAVSFGPMVHWQSAGRVTHYRIRLDGNGVGTPGFGPLTEIPVITYMHSSHSRVPRRGWPCRVHRESVARSSHSPRHPNFVGIRQRGGNNFASYWSCQKLISFSFCGLMGVRWP